SKATASLIDAMMMADFYPHHPREAELRQTHVSYVILAGEYAYKIKKPVQLPFIDCSTPAKRRELCEREVLLNRRLAPDVYLGVVPLVVRNGVFSSGEIPEGGGTVVEFAVKMRRLPDEQRLDNMAASGKISIPDVHALAKRIVELHAAASRSEAWRYGTAAAIWQLAVGNIAETERLLADTVSLDKLKVIEQCIRHYISSHWRFLNLRARSGRVLDGHGDLRADSVYFTNDGIRIVDCLEFSDALRWGDAASEIAFLAMDLDRLEHPELSAEFVRSYTEATKDADLAILLPFYKCHRAVVRAKVELTASREVDRPISERIACREKARRYLDQACTYASNSPTPGIIVVCGAPGTGKSTVARALGDLLGFEIVSSDSERKLLAGIAPTTRLEARYGEGIYSEDFTQQVYRALLKQAEQALKAGKGIILDATFRHRREREELAAAPFGVEPLYIECRADRDEVIRRLLERVSRPNEISGATVEVYLAQVKDFEPLDEIPGPRHMVADTTNDLTPVLAEVERRFR
ncbi:MAG: AAA family ATPase, partial [Deltaproteobacteria bacterium]|nr:AAA family ATPase [Deltaproteobacteria bacterium]